MSEIEVTEVPEEAPDWGRERRKAIEQVDLAPESLVSSWFVKLEGDEPGWQGIVVGEIQAGIYLVEIESTADGMPAQQRAVGAHSMLSDDADDGYEWVFFDSQVQMHDYVTKLRLAAGR